MIYPRISHVDATHMYTPPQLLHYIPSPTVDEFKLVVMIPVLYAYIKSRKWRSPDN